MTVPGLREVRDHGRAAVRVLVADQVPDRAAALTYFGLLAIFPALIVLVAVVGLFARSDALAAFIVGITTDLLPPGVEDVGPALLAAVNGRAQAGTAAVLGVVASVWAVSGYVAAFQRATAAIRGVPDDRAPWMGKLARLPLTLLLLAILAVIVLVLLASGPLGEAVERALGLTGLTASVWHVLRWPALFVVLNVFFALLNRGLPRSLRHARRRRTWFSPGGVAGIAIWLAASAVFSWYVATFATDTGSYGALGTAVVFLGWLWLGNFALLVGVEIDVRIVEQRHATAPVGNE